MRRIKIPSTIVPSFSSVGPIIILHYISRVILISILIKCISYKHGDHGNKELYNQLKGSAASGESSNTTSNNVFKFNKKRLNGKNRYETAELVAEEYNSSTVQNVILATGENFPDALSISSMAAMKGYPIVLGNKDTLPED